LEIFHVFRIPLAGFKLKKRATACPGVDNRISKIKGQRYGLKQKNQSLTFQLKPNPKQFACPPGLCIAAAGGVRKVSIQDFRYMAQTAPTQQAHTTAKPGQSRFPAFFTVG
jgi:hypothetical protein